MSNSCKWVPDAPNGKPSKLFQELQAKTGNRNIAKEIWAFTKTDLFLSEFSNLEKDVNGDFTYQAVANVLNLDSLFSPEEKDINLALDLGLMNRNKDPQTFDTANVALDKAAQFNKKATSKVAVVRETEDGLFATEILENTALNIAEADRDQARKKLNTALVRLIQKLGLNVDFVDDPSFQSVFNPKRANENAGMLSDIIRVSKGEKGAEELPEEASHLVIAGMKGHVLMERANAAFTMPVVKQILGDSYMDYYNKYKDGQMPVEDRLREEAQAKVLADILKGRATTGLNSSSPQRSLIQRIWDYVKNIFKKQSIADIDNAVVDAQSTMGDIADLMERDDFDTVLDRDSILRHEEMFDLVDKTQALYEKAQDGETLLSKKLSILQATNAKQDTKQLQQQIKNIRKQISDAHYEVACYSTLRAIGNDLAKLTQEAGRLRSVFATSTDLNVIASEAGLVYRLYSSVNGYLPYVKQLTKLHDLIKRGEIDMSPEWADTIENLADKYLVQLVGLKEDASRMRFSVLKQLICLFHGNNGERPSTFVETEKHKWESADMILRQAKEDIRFWDTGMFSAGASTNPLINVLHNIVVRQQAKRNQRINSLMMQLQEAATKLQRAGHDDKFVYQFDENGVPTGFYVAPVDMARFNRELKEYQEKVEADENIQDSEKATAIEKWKDEHMEEVPVMYGDPIDKKGTRRTEWLPKQSLYPNNDFQKGWDQTQKDYYKAIMDMKANMDGMLPPSYKGLDLYKAPQVLKSVTQMFDKDGKGAIKTIWSKWKKEYSVTKDFGGYGETSEQLVESKFKEVSTDFSDHILKRVPIYYINELQDLRDLSTDATHAMNNYIAMAVNYSEMGKLADAMRLMQDYVREDYEVVKTNAGKPLIDAFTAMSRKFRRPLVEPAGEGPNAVKAIIQYIDRNFWNETKNPLGDLKNPLNKDKVISMDAIFNGFLKLVSVSRMGINPLSGMTNVLQGETQMAIEATANRYFNAKDMTWAKGTYNAWLLDYMGNFNAIDRHDKMFMFINEFNSSEDFFRDMKDRNFNPTWLKRILGRGNIYFLNTMGEHYLHTMGMLMILKHEKVRRISEPQKEVSLFDVIKQVHDEKGWHLELDSDIEFVDRNKGFLIGLVTDENSVIKTTDRDKLFENLSVYINNVNSGMHGGYSEAEKGNMNRIAFFRACVQFRQWMFGMYNKLYSRSYYDAVMGVTQEGAYRTAMRWIVGVIQDWKRMSLKMALEENRLSLADKQNVRIAYVQSALYLGLAAMAMLTAGWKDKDDAALRLMAYNIRRLKLETGALSITNPVAFMRNALTLLQSPAAGVKTIENVTQMFDFFTWSQLVQSGRFKGWWKPAKALWVSTPFYNIQKLIDMDDYSYMFNIFK